MSVFRNRFGEKVERQKIPKIYAGWVTDEKVDGSSPYVLVMKRSKF